MEEFKKMIQGFDPKMAFIINAAFAVIFLVFFLVLPFVPNVSGATLLGHAPFTQLLILLFMLLAPIASVLYAYMKKKLCHRIVCTLTGVLLVTLFVLGYFGIGSILNIIILLAWGMFTFYRKDMPAEI